MAETRIISADLIAAGLSPFAPELAARRAGRLMLEEIARRFKAGLSNFEGLYRPLVNEWQTIDNGGPAPRLRSEGGRP